MLVANMKEKDQTKQRLVAIMKNAQKRVAQVWIVAKTRIAVQRMAKWNVARMVNALKKGIMVRIVAKKKASQKQIVVKIQNVVKNHN